MAGTTNAESNYRNIHIIEASAESDGLPEVGLTFGELRESTENG
jgi:hypothetical protein